MSTTPFVFDKEKYIRMMKAEGISVALTQLHKDTIRWEHQAFEGEEGYHPQMWADLHAVRDSGRFVYRKRIIPSKNRVKK
jgi:hypothetical protein